MDNLKGLFEVFWKNWFCRIGPNNFRNRVKYRKWKRKWTHNIFIFGVQVPYNVKPKTSSSSRAVAGGYTQFMSFGIETGAQLKLGKPITIWGAETIKLTLMAVAPESWREMKQQLPPPLGRFRALGWSHFPATFNPAWKADLHTLQKIKVKDLFE